MFDPDSFSNDETKNYVIKFLTPSFDGNKIAFAVAPNGSESAITLIMDVNTKKLYPEKIDRCWFEASWLPDGSGFFINRLNSSDVHDKNREKNTKCYLHLLNTDPSTDKEIFSRELYPELGIKPKDIPFVIYSKDSHYLFAYALTVDRRYNVFYAK